jgi:hypothetical protein
MSRDNILAGMLIILLALSSLPGFYRRSVPRRIWYISLFSASLVGIIIGCMTPFPINIVASIVLAGAFMGLIVLMWLPTKRWRK